jgi:hypothetical protein
MSPRYGELFRQAGNLSETVFGEAVWFERQMDKVPNDASTSFVVLGPWTSPISGLYAPHVTNHLLTLDLERFRLTDQSAYEIRNGARPIVAVYGPPDEVARMIATFPEDLGVGTSILDVTHRSDLGYRLVVYTMPDATRLPFTWSAENLPRVTGRLEGDTVAVEAGDPAGVVTFGPYIDLPVGRYRIEVRYRSANTSDFPVGGLEAYSVSVGSVATVPLSGTDGVDGSASVTFEVEGGGPWEFRTSHEPGANLLVESITLDHA